MDEDTKTKLPPGFHKVGYILDDASIEALRKLARIQDRTRSATLRHIIREAAIQAGVWKEDARADDTSGE